MASSRLALLLLLWRTTDATPVTLETAAARRAADGSYVDAHDGKIVYHDGTYFLYGESYGNQTLATRYPWRLWPRLAVYTSPDLKTWTYRGPAITRRQHGGTLWIPNVIYHAPSQRFIMWFGSGGWGTATSTDGVNFTPAVLGQSSRFGPKARTDGTGVFVDDDGQGYIVFASNPAGVDEPAGHVVSIEKLSDDLLSSTKVNVTGLFPDDYVESPALFKRKGVYYVTYGSCCCGCKEGGGIVVFTSRDGVAGPWARQRPAADVNCQNTSAPICGGFGLRDQQAGDLIYTAQWWGPSFIPMADGSTTILFLGRKWLSGPHVPPGCNDICGNRGKPELCQAGGGAYALRSDESVWVPLEFNDTTGAVLPLRLVPNFTLDILTAGPPATGSHTDPGHGLGPTSQQLMPPPTPAPGPPCRSDSDCHPAPPGQSARWRCGQAAAGTVPTAANNCHLPGPGTAGNATCSCYAQHCEASPDAPGNASAIQYLVIGDSISLGLTPDLNDLLDKGVGWELTHNPGNAASSNLGAHCIDQWLAGRTWDVISFQFGLHDLAFDTERISVDEYGRIELSVGESLGDRSA